MTDYRDTPAARPWSKSLEVGDVLTPMQADSIDSTRLRDFGLALHYDGDGVGGTAVAVVRIEPR